MATESSLGPTVAHKDTVCPAVLHSHLQGPAISWYIHGTEEQTHQANCSLSFAEWPSFFTDINVRDSLAFAFFKRQNILEGVHNIFVLSCTQTQLNPICFILETIYKPDLKW